MFAKRNRRPDSEGGGHPKPRWWISANWVRIEKALDLESPSYDVEQKKARTVPVRAFILTAETNSSISLTSVGDSERDFGSLLDAFAVADHGDGVGADRCALSHFDRHG